MPQFLTTLWLTVAPVLTGVGALTVALLLVNFVGARKAKVESLARRSPRVVAALEMFRAAGFEPWHFWKYANAFVRGKLPDRIEAVVDVVIPPPPPSPRFRDSMLDRMADAARKTGTFVAVLLACWFATGCSTAKVAARTAAHCTVSVQPLNGEYALALIQTIPHCNEYAHLEDCPDYKAVTVEYEVRYAMHAKRCAEESDS